MRGDTMQAIIFDMDGLMIDSERVTFECYQEVMKTMGLTMDRDFYVTLLGHTADIAKKQFEKVYGKNFPYEDALKKTHTLMARRFINEGVPLKPGLLELLQYLKKHHYKTIVATSSTRKRVDSILNLAHLTSYFDDSICGDEVTNSKPDPEIFIKACRKLHVSKNHALVLEDSEAGIQAAYNGQIKVICIPDMKQPEEQYVKMTEQVLPSLNDVTPLLKKHRLKRL